MNEDQALQILYNLIGNMDLRQTSLCVRLQCQRPRLSYVELLRKYLEEDAAARPTGDVEPEDEDDSGYDADDEHEGEEKETEQATTPK